MTGNNKSNLVLYLIFLIVGALGLALILTRNNVPSYQDCLTRSQTGVGAALCAIMGVDAILRLKPDIKVTDTGEIDRLMKRLEKAEVALADERRISLQLQATMGQLLESTNDLLQEINNLPDGSKPLGPDFYRLYYNGACSGGGTTDYCGEEGEVFRPIPDEPDA